MLLGAGRCGAARRPAALLRRFASSFRPSNSLTTNQIRTRFVDYFKRQGHEHVPSASLLPAAGDGSLLFTNAGMVPFKEVFAGSASPPGGHSRLVTVQRCLRAGGKHNDLDNVGFTARHHTFFEMLGNFAFQGSYFKEQAIYYAWEFLTRELQLPAERLRPSVFDSDDEAAVLWSKIAGRDVAARLVRLGAADNFWAMGDGAGPCGPCSEIFFDQGCEVDGERWLELWNVVFMQYKRDANGQLHPLPRGQIDTGMGLERVAAVLQGHTSNWDNDLLAALQLRVRELVGRLARPGAAPLSTAAQLAAVRVVTDHLRAAAFLLADGAVPSAAGRGYVLRRLIRRAARYAHALGVREPLLAPLVPALVELMGDAYPELAARAPSVTAVLHTEEKIFLSKLDEGLAVLARELPSSAAAFPPPLAARLWTSFGFPVDLSELIARERKLSFDRPAVEQLLEARRAQSIASWKATNALPAEVMAWQRAAQQPRFTGYERLEEPEAEVLAVHEDGAGRVYVSLTPCPFYAAGGGQVGDVGELRTAAGVRARVLDTLRPYEGGAVLLLAAESSDTDLLLALRPGTHVHAAVLAPHRVAVRAHHTATHLLHAALRRLLGPAVQQAGSQVSPASLRFDFTHAGPLSPAHLHALERDVNTAIEADASVSAELLPLDEALRSGAVALFSEKYPPQVRVIRAGDSLSAELCGGTHAARTGELRVFKIISETAVSAGTRRIEAVAGAAAVEWLERQAASLQNIAQTFRCGPDEALAHVQRLQQRTRSLEKELDHLKTRLVSATTASSPIMTAEGSDWTTVSAPLGQTGLRLVLTRLLHAADAADEDTLRRRCDALRRADPMAVHLLLAPPRLLCTVARPSEGGSAVAPSAREILAALLKPLGGASGGRPHLAEGKLPSALLDPGAVRAHVLAWAPSIALAPQAAAAPKAKA